MSWPNFQDNVPCRLAFRVDKSASWLLVHWCPLFFLGHHSPPLGSSTVFWTVLSITAKDTLVWNLEIWIGAGTNQKTAFFPWKPKWACHILQAVVHRASVSRFHLAPTFQETRMEPVQEPEVEKRHTWNIWWQCENVFGLLYFNIVKSHRLIS